MERKSGFQQVCENKGVIAGFLWLELKRGFITEQDANDFCKKLIHIAWLESKLNGDNTPTANIVETLAKEYFVKFVPQIYDRILEDARSKAKYHSYTYKDCGHDIGVQLETFFEGEDHFFHLKDFADEIENLVRAKYKK